MHARPSFFADFLNDYGYLDPRISFNRAGAGTYCDRNGILRTRTQNNSRFNFQPSTGYPTGLRGEQQATNLMTFSEDFTAWIKTGTTVTANTNVAPDGNTAGDTITSTLANGSVAQNATITAGQTCYGSVFVQKASSQFCRLTLAAAADQVSVFFNLNTGTVGTHTQVGGGTVVWGIAYIESWPGGWFRCSLAVSTTTPTTVALYVQPATSDGASPVNSPGDSIAAWGAMMNATAAPGGGPGYGKVQSYIAAPAGVTVTRFNENCWLTLPDPTWFDPTQGTLFADFVAPVGSGLNTAWAFGFGNTASDYAGIQVQLAGGLATSNIYGSMVSGGVAQSFPTDTGAITAFDTSYRVAMGFRQGDYTTLCVNGRPVQQSGATVTVPVGPVRMTVGGWPWTTSMSGVDLRRIAYFPKKLTNAQLIKLTT